MEKIKIKSKTYGNREHKIHTPHQHWYVGGSRKQETSKPYLIPKILWEESLSFPGAMEEAIIALHETGNWKKENILIFHQRWSCNGFGFWWSNSRTGEKEGKWLTSSFIYLVGTRKRRKIPFSNSSDYFRLVVQFVSLLPPKQAKALCHVTLKKRIHFSLVIRHVSHILMIIQAVPLGLKNTDSGTIVTKPADIMEEFPHRKDF